MLKYCLILFTILFHCHTESRLVHLQVQGPWLDTQSESTLIVDVKGRTAKSSLIVSYSVHSNNNIYIVDSFSMEPIKKQQYWLSEKPVDNCISPADCRLKFFKDDWLEYQNKLKVRIEGNEFLERQIIRFLISEGLNREDASEYFISLKHELQTGQIKFIWSGDHPQALRPHIWIKPVEKFLRIQS